MPVSDTLSDREIALRIKRSHTTLFSQKSLIEAISGNKTLLLYIWLHWSYVFWEKHLPTNNAIIFGDDFRIFKKIIIIFSILEEWREDISNSIRLLTVVRMWYWIRILLAICPILNRNVGLYVCVRRISDSLDIREEISYFSIENRFYFPKNWIPFLILFALPIPIDVWECNKFLKDLIFWSQKQFRKIDFFLSL